MFFEKNIYYTLVVELDRGVFCVEILDVLVEKDTTQHRVVLDVFDDFEVHLNSRLVEDQFSFVCAKY